MAATPFADGFAERLRQARERAGMTLRELGAEAGINYSQVSRYEQGIAFPRPKVLQRMADVLGAPIKHLRDGEELISIPFGDVEYLRLTFTPEMYLRLKAEAEAEGVTVQQMVVLLAKEHLARIAAETSAEDLDEVPDGRQLSDFVDDEDRKPKKKR